MVKLLLSFICFTLLTPTVLAQTDSETKYTKENPLVIEDSESIWPYSFLNDMGEPEGYCVDLIRIMMKELDIPYVIRLKSHQETLRDLQSGKADLVLGLGDVYEEHYGHYGRTSVTLLTQSVATPKGQPVAIKTFRDLKDHHVIVKDSGLCHHLMVDYGWGHQAIVSHDIAKAIQELNDKGEGQVVWNTLTLQWLINHYHLDNLSLTPVNMPHGVTKFLSNDLKLLEQIDNTYSNLSAAGKLRPLEAKWFYPNHEKTKSFHWVWLLTAIVFTLLVAIMVFLIRELRQNRHSTKRYHELAHQLAQVAEHDKVRFWTYDINEQKFAWHNEYGMVINTYTPEEFAQRYNKEDFALLKEELDRLITQHLDNKGHEETEETMELTAKDIEFGDAEVHGFVLHLSVLSRDAHGKPTVIIGAKKDITRERRLKKINTERSLRYLSMFYNNESGVLSFDKDGYLIDANPKASEMLMCDVDEIVKMHTHISNLLLTDMTNLNTVDGTYGTLSVGTHIVNYQIKVIRNDQKEIIGLFVFCI